MTRKNKMVGTVIGCVAGAGTFGEISGLAGQSASKKGIISRIWSSCRLPSRSPGASLSLLLSVLCLSAPALSEPMAQTAEGPVSGFVEGDSVHYRGIPYAQAPVGALRWQAPQPPKPRSERLEAVSFGPACPQRGRVGEASEDCLTLNISTPFAAKQDDRLPVLVWIHGGGFVVGSGAAETYDSRLWNADDIILVTLNYRLGVLGFFAHEALDDSQGVNYGLLDMVAALRWIKANIGAFGGDPARVTVGGISAGGMAVQMLMASPLSEGLFQGAISQSGYGTWPLPRSRSVAAHQDSKVAESIAIELAERAIGKPAGEISIENLYSATPEQWVNAVEGFHLPVVDGLSLPDEPGLVFRRGDQHPVPLISGANGFDGSIFPYSGIAAETLLEMTGSHRPRVARLYEINPSKTNSLSVKQLFGDMRYVLSARFATQQMHKVDQSAYLYLFDYTPAEKSSEWPGAPHGSEGPLLFKDDTTPIAKAMRRYWTNFIKTGNPNAADLPDWPAVTAGKAPWMVFDDQPAVKEDLRRTKLDVMESAYRERVEQRLR